jgi:phosphoribosyl-dephospho-CoA transferase
MALRAHDILRLSKAAFLPEFSALPEWALDSLRASPFVVVRRALAPDGFVPIGIRGQQRSQRAAALLPVSAVEECISPEALAARQPWLDSSLRAALPQLRALRSVAEAAAWESLVWGPVGSVAFELATGAHVIQPESDLDILVRFSSRITTPALRHFRESLTALPVHVDVTLETGGCAAALDEYLESPHHLLIKTPEGPRLGDFAR